MAIFHKGDLVAKAVELLQRAEANNPTMEQRIAMAEVYARLADSLESNGNSGHIRGDAGSAGGRRL